MAEENGEDEPDDDPADEHDYDELEQCHSDLLDCDGLSVAARPDVAIGGVTRSVDEQRAQIDERADPSRLDHNDDPNEPPLVSASTRRGESRSSRYLPVDGGL